MKYNAYKFFTIGQYEKEEKWLNEMSAKGMQLTDVGFCRYSFVKGTPGEYIYRLELLEHMPGNAESVSYISFLEETGIEQVGSILRWIYLRKKASDGPFELYSDTESKINHYKRILFIADIMSIALLFSFLPNLTRLIFKIIELVKMYGSFDSFFMRQLNPHAGFTIFYFALIAFLQLVVLPIRKSKFKLIKEKTVHE
jgi:hypothetical protein